MSTVSKDGMVRYLLEKGDLFRQKREQAEKAARQIDIGQIEFFPAVDVQRRVVVLSTGKFWYAYGVADNGAVRFLPERSNQLVPGPDPQHSEFTKIVLHAFMSASGVAPQYLSWDYRGSLDANGSPKSGLSADELKTLRALQRLDSRRTGIVTATREHVAAAMLEV